MRNLEQAAHTLQAVRDLGVFVAIDDFGTGYSSLAYLRKLPLDTLKIDRSFVRDVVTDPHAAAVVKSIIALGQSLDLRIVAEGVETEDQFRLLQELRCDAGQGYFFAPPLPTAEFEGRFLKPRRLDL
jgi:EAL domain-containing protein (putative c-di-GMP-specific phosphodiesterase class I)